MSDKHWTEVIAFGRVVVDDVENDFDARTVKRFDEIFEFEDLLAALSARRVLVVRREVANLSCSPRSGDRVGPG